MRARLSGVLSLASLLIVAGQGCGSRGASASGIEAARAFFNGKTMTYVVATEPGGGYDTYGRLVARFIGKYLGLTRVVVKNVPGAGHLRGANEILYARADGLTLGTFNSGVIYGELLRTDGLTLNLRAMSWVGKAGADSRVMVVSRASGFRTLEDVRGANRPLLIATSGVGTQGHNDAVLLAHILGLKIRLVHGLASNDAQLSMMRGEVDGEFASFSSYRTFVSNGYGHVVFRIGDDLGDEMLAPPLNLAAVPVAADAGELLDLIRTQAVLARWTAGPPGISADRLTVLREAYMTALGDPELLEEARRLRLPIVPMDGVTLADEIARVLSQPPAAATRIAALLGRDRSTTR